VKLVTQYLVCAHLCCAQSLPVTYALPLPFTVLLCTLACCHAKPLQVHGCTLEHTHTHTHTHTHPHPDTNTATKASSHTHTRYYLLPHTHTHTHTHTHGVTCRHTSAPTLSGLYFSPKTPGSRGARGANVPVQATHTCKGRRQSGMLQNLDPNLNPRK